MFGHVAAFELKYQLRQPLFWAVGLVFFLLAVLFTASDAISVGDAGNLHKNSPYAVAIVHLIFGIFFMFVSAAFVAGAVLKDDETGFGPILRATRLSKFDYVLGRYAGALTAAVLCFAFITLGCIAGSFAPWLDAEQKGPFLIGGYLYAYLVLGLPSVLMTSALFFLLATLTRSMAWTFIGVIAVLVGYFIFTAATGKPELETVIAPWEPSGLGAYGLATKYWTASERNGLTPPLAGALLFNRVFVLGLAVVFLTAAYALFRVRAVGGKQSSKAEAATPRPAIGADHGRPRFDTAALAGQIVARTRHDIAAAFKSVTFWLILVFGLANAGIGMWFATTETPYGGEILPATRVMIPVLEGAFSIFTLIIATYFAGDLVWRDRERKFNEIVDATPAPDFSFVLPKTLAVALVLIATVAASVLLAMAIQTARGDFNFEIGKYLAWYLIPQSADLVIVAALAVFLQTIAPNKFVGWGLMIAWIVAILTLPQTGAEHRLYLLARPNFPPLSDMNGQGRYWIAAWWFRAYWAAFAAILLVLAVVFWRRGAAPSWRSRLTRAPARLTGPAGLTLVGALVLFIGLGGFIFYNTNVRNPFRTQRSDDQWAADYERALLRYEFLPQPDIEHVQLKVTIHPGGPRVETQGEYILVNRTGQPLREAHVRFARDVDVRALGIEGAWAKTSAYDRFNYRIFAFNTPMQPGERRRLTFTASLGERGFRNRGEIQNVVANGTFLNSFDIAPLMGMTRDMLLRDRSKRRREHLTPLDLQPRPLGDPVSRGFSYIGHMGWATSDITVTTDADQTPIAPGQKVSDVTSGGRRTARYVSEAPILEFYSIQSARYAVKTETYKGVALSVYYDPHHPMNVDRMLTALKSGLDYYQANFSPYQFHQVRIVEFPDYARFAQSFAGTFPWSEGLGFIADYHDKSRIDLVTYVAAHELAHQWWAHQIVGADQQGATALSESLAQYSALRVMRRLYGPDMIRKFLKFELDSYLRNRGVDVVDEQPLERVENQPYIHYRKASLVMYRLAEEIGEDKVNAALRSLIATYAFKGAPYPTALDLVAALRAQAPPDKQQLITDLFEKITLYDLRADRATATRRADGKWDVTLTIRASKAYADGKGRETPAPMAENAPIGLFARDPKDGAFTAADVILVQPMRVTSGRQTFHFIVDRKPAFAGVDAYNQMIDRNGDDNSVKVGG